MIKTSSLVLALGVAVALPMPAPAQTGTEELVQVGVLDGGVTERGTQMAALELTLAEGWKTYWRAPGEAGIPPRFDWRDSHNVAAVRIHWPTPIVFDQSGFQSIGYESRLVLPVEITPAKPGNPVRLSGRIELGICRDICIPDSVTFDSALDPKAARNPAIAAALAQRPYSAAESGMRKTTCRIAPIDGGVRLTAQITMPPTGEPEVAVIEPGDPAIWASQTQHTRAGDVLTATTDLYHEGNGGFALDRSAIRITVLGRSRAVDIMGCAAP
ncbi:protein-disulfide reductase DsbD domain-containing protein [Pontibaca salina]|uniref:Thiol:disulfide interchange protein DsbD N-terminal domain-containing protein n=1 Tax=Pontibaca salina TaxID=2795731 RepID=A0A934HPU6_9RHOB|nr:protein-disulfide reductase DsbD domain-containing protein [Pontibaca salina]MBI6629317.1 hypothetical protein [Pontibaca salina]